MIIIIIIYPVVTSAKCIAHEWLEGLLNITQPDDPVDRYIPDLNPQITWVACVPKVTPEKSVVFLLGVNLIIEWSPPSTWVLLLFFLFFLLLQCIKEYRIPLTCPTRRVLGELPEVVLGHETSAHGIDAFHPPWRRRVVHVPRGTGLKLINKQMETRRDSVRVEINDQDRNK